VVGVLDLLLVAGGRRIHGSLPIRRDSPLLLLELVKGENGRGGNEEVWSERAEEFQRIEGDVPLIGRAAGAFVCIVGFGHRGGPVMRSVVPTEYNTRNLRVSMTPARRASGTPM